MSSMANSLATEMLYVPYCLLMHHQLFSNTNKLCRIFCDGFRFTFTSEIQLWFILCEHSNHWQQFCWIVRIVLGLDHKMQWSDSIALHKKIMK